ncbi:MAG: hypothetical protein K0R61_5408 [Microvirga sp.]|nr:hypothetical protein [Microvirga sp.]MDF2974958.1 hypothetical protein [Microvirga sp.]
MLRDCLATRANLLRVGCISQVNKAFLQLMLRLLVVALAAGAAGCVVHQKSRGVFPTEHLPPPPSEPGLKGSTSQTEAQAGTPERKPLSVPR